VRDVERVLRLSRSAIRGLIVGGFVTPERGPRRQYRFSFQDLVVLRTAQELTRAKLSPRRIRRSLDDLRRHLPDAMPLSGLSISAVGDRVVVREGKNRWQVDDGQYLLELDVTMDDGVLRVVDRTIATARKAAHASAPQPRDDTDWFEHALELEASDPRAACEAYARAVSFDPKNTGAWTNWGRLLHEQGDKVQAEHVYRRALAGCGTDALLLFNLGVLLEDLQRPDAALEAYQRALADDPELADCHYNLARLYESMGKAQQALRHLGKYRRLVSG
jgi:hypothetical protein